VEEHVTVPLERLRIVDWHRLIDAITPPKRVTKGWSITDRPFVLHGRGSGIEPKGCHKGFKFLMLGAKTIEEYQMSVKKAA